MPAKALASVGRGEAGDREHLMSGHQKQASYLAGESRGWEAGRLGQTQVSRARDGLQMGQGGWGRGADVLLCRSQSGGLFTPDAQSRDSCEQLLCSLLPLVIEDHQDSAQTWQSSHLCQSRGKVWFLLRETQHAPFTGFSGLALLTLMMAVRP